MPLNVWNTSDYSLYSIILVSVVSLIFLLYGIFKVRKHNWMKFLFSFFIGVILTTVAVLLINYLSPKTVHMYYKYNDNMEIFSLTDMGWEIVDHYGDKKIVHVTMKGGK